ncbi:hypothetical protein [Alistipes sp.]|jgi:hypothetical protein|uniref:hypothetical protein n=1 Tax=Alistipes sp. TaxID=1872444 RepID=UPI001326D4D2|nr:MULTISPECIES: hypothetical protein [Alistipes]MUU02470.1 hypothetical protein [Alistipes sp.]
MVRGVFVSKIVKNVPKWSGACLPACRIFLYRRILKICVKITVFSDMREICFRKKSDSRMMRWLGSWFSGLRGACGVDRGLAVCAWRTRTAASGTGVKKSLRQVPKALEILQAGA